MNEKVKRLLSDTAVLGMGTFVSKLIVFLMLPLYTAYLSPDMYSTADLIAQAANLIIPFACFGMTDAIFRFIADKQRDKGAVLSSGLFAVLVGFLVFLVLSPLLSLFDKFDGFVWLIVLYVLAADIHALFAQCVRAEGRVNLFAIQGIFNTVSTVCLNILFLVAFNMGIIGYVLSVVVSDLLSTLFILVIARPLKSIRLSLVKKELIAEMLKYCLPLIPTTVFWWITNVSDRYIVSTICGDTVNGIYSAAYKIPTLLTLASAVFNEAWQYFAFSGRASDTRKEEGDGVGDKLSQEAEMGYYFEKTFAAFSTVMFLACSFLMLICKPLIGILLADAYAEAWEYVPTLLIATAFMALVTFLSSPYALRKKTVMSFVTAAIGAAVNILLNIILIPKFGAIGAAFATMICYILVFVLRSLNSRKYVSFKIYTPSFVAGAFILVAQCISFVIIGEYNIMIQLVFFLLSVVVAIPTVLRVGKTLFTKN